MNIRKWPFALGLVTVTAVVSAITTLALQSPRAVAQAGAHCEILWVSDGVYGQLANQVAGYVAKGYVPAGFAAQPGYLYAMVCRK